MEADNRLRRSGPFRAFCAKGHAPLSVDVECGTIIVRREGEAVLRASFAPGDIGRLSLAEPCRLPPDETLRAASAALEAVLADAPAIKAIALDGDGWLGAEADMLRSGFAIDAGGERHVLPELFWQFPRFWLPAPPAEPYPQTHILTNGQRHPRRAPKPTGEVYARHIPWLGQTLSFRALDIDTDLARFNRWMNDPRVAYFWKEEGDLDKHRAYLGAIAADPHMLTLIGCADGVPFSYFEIYWAKENRLGPFYDAQDYDRGWHVLIGEDAFLGRHWITAWLPSLMHYIFLDDCRTQRIVGEPAADHHQQIRNLQRSGFACVKHFDFPHKRAMLVMLLRERFFGDRLWAPNDAGEQRRSA
ncbi:GNAT family N-acetyltransferase [Rhodomicrobium vannielii]|nr:GNAT family N-acetyltransferase [Rhodomicrobium vannielii]